VRQWRHVLVSDAREVLGDCPLVDDVVQTVFVKMFDDGAWRELETPRAYCRRAARREALRALESRRRGRPLTDIEEHARSTSLGPDDLVIRMDDQARLLACLRRLPERCALVMTLSLVEGLTHREIADRLGISRGAVEKQVARGRTYLRRLMTIDAEGNLIWLSSIEDGGGVGTLIGLLM